MDENSEPQDLDDINVQRTRMRYTDWAKDTIAQYYDGGQFGADPKVLEGGVEGARALLPNIDGALELLALYHLYQATSAERGFSVSPILRPLFDDEDLEPIEDALHEADLAVVGTRTPTEAGLAVLDLLIPESAPHTYTVEGFVKTKERRDELMREAGFTNIDKLYNLASRMRIDQELSEHQDPFA